MPTPDISAITTLDPKAIFTVAEAARILGMTHNGVLTRIARMKIRAGRTGSRYFIPGSEIQKQLVLPQFDV
jgi:excisionase family DNA binding protein